MYPFRLMQHGPYHTPLVAHVSTRRARDVSPRSTFGRPRVTLVDGRGVRFTPWSADVDALREYTLGAQVTSRTTSASRSASRCASTRPTTSVCPGPGNSLG
jgi:hypothetical protein